MDDTNIHNMLRRLEPSRLSSGDTALVARQPIFDLTGRVWGYELLFRDPSLKPGLGGIGSQAATSTVMIDGFELMRPTLVNQQRFFINFTAEFLEAELPAVLPPEICVIEILESVEPSVSVITGIRNLKKRGYLFALDDYVGQPHLEPFLSLVDIVKVDVLSLSPMEAARQAATLARYPVRLLAEKVETHEVAERCRAQGFTLFQGFFYGKAEVVRGKKLAPSQITKARLISLAADQEIELEKLIESISADVFLSYKLLKLVNSVYFGLAMQIRHVGHAAYMLGTKRVKQWLCVTALAEMDASPMSQELVCFSALRAKFLEQLARKHFSRSPKQHSDVPQLFLVGLFSLLESMLRMPLSEILASLSLDDRVQQVLAEGTGPLAPWYQLMQAYEAGDWTMVKKLSSNLSLSSHDLASAYIEAGSWSTEVFGALRGDN